MKYLEMEAALRRAGWKYAGDGKWARPNHSVTEYAYDLLEAVAIQRVNDRRAGKA